MAWLTEPFKALYAASKLGAPVGTDEKCLSDPSRVTKRTFLTMNETGVMGGGGGRSTGSYPVVGS